MPQTQQQWVDFIQELNRQEIAANAVPIEGGAWFIDAVFASTDADTVEWDAHTLTLSNGTSYSIDAGNTGFMSTPAFIYIDLSVSTTAYSTTTTGSDAVGEDKLLIAVAEPAIAGSTDSTWTVFGGQDGSGTFIAGNQIAANSIAANEIAASTITSAEISANTITADQIATTLNWAQTFLVASGGEVRMGQTDYDTGTGFWLGDDAGTAKFSIGAQFGNKLTWDGSTLNVVGSVSGALDSSDLIGLMAANIVRTEAIQALAVDTANIALAAVDTSQLALNAVDSNIIAPLAVATSHIQAGAVEAGNINVGTLSAIAADMGTLTAGTITLNASGHIKSGQTAYDTGTGFFLGYSAGAKFSIGNSAGNKLTWDGSNLSVNGTVTGSISSSGLTGNIPTDLVVADSILAGAVVAGKIDAGAVDTAELAVGAVEAGNINVANLAAINADMGALTAGTITLDATGHIKSGQTAYDTGIGFFLGQSTGVKFSVGDSTGNKMTWNGSTLSVTGSIDGTIQSSGLSGNIPTDLVVADSILAGTIISSKLYSGGIAANRIQANNIAAGVITSTEIASNTIVANNILAGEITTVEMASALTWTQDMEISTGGQLYSGQTAWDTGTGFWLEYNAGVPRFSIGNSAANKLTWNGSTLTIVGNVSGDLSAGDLTGTVAIGAQDIATQSWNYNGAFTVLDADTVQWAASSLNMADGTNYSIGAGNTGNMTGTTWVYFDADVSTIAFQTTSTPANVVGANKVPIAVCQNGTTEARFIRFGGRLEMNINAGNIEAGSITANEITAGTITGDEINAVFNLSGNNVTADTGTIGGWTLGANTLSSGSMTFNSSTQRILIGSATSATAGVGVMLGLDNSVYNFRAGDPAGDQIYWNGSTLSITGNITADSGSIGGWTLTSTTIEDAAGVVGMSSAVTGGDDIRFWAGDATPASAEFRVTEAGALTATSATITGTVTATAGAIGGWTLASGSLSSGNVRIESTDERIEMGSGVTGPTTGTGIWMGNNGGTYEFRAGDPSNDYIHWDGSTLTLVGDLSITNSNNSFTAASLSWDGGSFSSTPTGTFYYLDLGNLVIMWCTSAITGTSNSTATFAANGFPAAVRPATGTVRMLTQVVNSGTTHLGDCTINSSGRMVWQMLYATGTGTSSEINGSAAFDNSGAKGIPAGATWIIPTS